MRGTYIYGSVAGRQHLFTVCRREIPHKQGHFGGIRRADQVKEMAPIGKEPGRHVPRFIPSPIQLGDRRRRAALRQDSIHGRIHQTDEDHVIPIPRTHPGFIWTDVSNRDRRAAASIDDLYRAAVKETQPLAVRRPERGAGTRYVGEFPGRGVTQVSYPDPGLVASDGYEGDAPAIRRDRYCGEDLLKALVGGGKG